MRVKDLLTEQQSLIPYSSSKHQTDVEQIDSEVFGDLLDTNEYQNNSGLVYKDNDNVVAYVLWDDSSEAPHIRSLAVKKEYSNAGLGTKLMTKALQLLGPIVTVTIDDNQESLKRFYKKFGFAGTGQTNPSGNEVWKKDDR